MKSFRFVLTALAVAAGVWFSTGCASSHTSPYHPGPVAGQAVGTGVGVVAGNVAGFGVGVVEGTAHGVAAPFDPSYHMVRQWRTETTADGRTIQVPYDILVDKYGHPVNMPAPTGNPAPPPVTPPPPPATNDATK